VVAVLAPLKAIVAPAPAEAGLIVPETLKVSPVLVDFEEIKPEQPEKKTPKTAANVKKTSPRIERKETLPLTSLETVFCKPIALIWLPD
jgi:hypothetical protein